MKRKVATFDEKLYEKCRKELNRKDARKIILKYGKKHSLTKVYKLEFLSHYYSPILTTLRRFLGKLKNKNILEIGYRMPMFLDYLKKQGSTICGIDVEPYITNRNLLKMSVEKINPKFLSEHKNQFHSIIERLTLSRLYEEEYFSETGKHRFKNKEKILSNLYKLLRPKGILVLQDDRGTIFTKAQFAKMGFKKVMKEVPITFKDKKGKNLGWNVLIVYQKTKRD